MPRYDEFSHGLVNTWEDDRGWRKLYDQGHIAAWILHQGKLYFGYDHEAICVRLKIPDVALDRIPSGWIRKGKYISFHVVRGNKDDVVNNLSLFADEFGEEVMTLPILEG